MQPLEHLTDLYRLSSFLLWLVGNEMAYSQSVFRHSGFMLLIFQIGEKTMLLHRLTFYTNNCETGEKT